MKTVLKLAAVLVLLVMIGGAVTLQSAIKDARVEQQELSKTSASAGAGVKKSHPAEANGEVLRLREANKDLPKLRNEVRQLRRQAEEMAKLSADNEKLKNTPKPSARQYPPGYIRRAALTDAGLATPEATLQTFLWAMTSRNVSRLKDCVSSEHVAELAHMNDEQLQHANEFPGFRIVSRNEISLDRVELTIEIMPGFEDNGLPIVKMKRVGNEWKLNGGF